MGYVLLTGATGMLGQYLLRDALLAQVPVAVVTRSSRVASARQRIDDLLGYWEQSLGIRLVRPVVLHGDLRQPGLEMSAHDRQWVGDHCTSVLHSAASLTFYNDPATGEPHRTNVAGTQHLLQLCLDTGIRRFQHVSTAYVCGQRSGHIREDELDAGQLFGNDYERSKFEAECLVRKAKGLDVWTIFRPSIIVGDSKTGFTSAYNGFYTPLQVTHALRNHPEFGTRSEQWFLEQLALCGDERKNLVPVDWVSAVIVHVLQNAYLHGRTYHLTSPNPVTSRAIQKAIVDSMGDAIVGNLQEKTAPLSDVSDVAPIADRPVSDDAGGDVDFREHMEVYRSYLRDDPWFDGSNTQAAAPHLPCPEMNEATLTRLTRFAVAANFGWPRRRPGPPRFDVADWLAAICRKSGCADPVDGWLALECSGPGGGAWEIGFSGNRPIVAELGRSARASGTVYASVVTIERMAERALCVSTALERGAIIIESSAGEADRVAQAFGWLVDALSQAEGSPRIRVAENP